MMNMQSTQRAESVHSAMGGFLTASGLLTTLAEKLDVETPICEAVAAVLAGEITLNTAVDGLLSRPIKSEL